jgi:hydrogenase expression/formation protein HypE
MSRDQFITLEEGAGGIESAELIESIFKSRFNQDLPSTQQEQDPFADGARLDFPSGRLIVSTDGFVVQPAEFPGGNIGKIAACGTINDVAVSGGKPLFLAASFIIEEGYSKTALIRVVESMAAVLCETGVQLVTGDTKVVPKGEADGIYITTTGIGSPVCELSGKITEGDVVIASGTLGEHGLAILAAREGLLDDQRITSDCAPVVHQTLPLLEELGGKIRLMRDPTRGGLATTLWEIVRESDYSLEITQTALPFDRSFRACAEMLGLDLLHLPSEGRFIMVISPEAADRALEILRDNGAIKPAIIGKITRDRPGKTILITEIGGQRQLLPLSNEQLPRIC